MMIEGAPSQYTARAVHSLDSCFGLEEEKLNPKIHVSFVAVVEGRVLATVKIDGGGGGSVRTRLDNGDGGGLW